MSLYLLINILTIAIPLALSFDKKVHFVSYWRFLIPAIVLTMTLFIVWDVIFTSHGVWGFNERYHSQMIMLGLPLEEYLFFITVPYATIFTIYVIDHYFPNIRLNKIQVRYISFILMASLLITAIIYARKVYTAVSFITLAMVMGLVLVKKPELLSRFFISYLVILIPFGIVNGILTGSFIDDQVVWYNNQENLGIRVGSIPVEDFFYGMTLILLNFFLTDTFQNRAARRKQISI